jgi:hypothetical protein
VPLVTYKIACSQRCRGGDHAATMLAVDYRILGTHNRGRTP